MPSPRPLPTRPYSRYSVAGAEVILASGELVDGELPADTTAWLRLG